VLLGAIVILAQLASTHVVADEASLRASENVLEKSISMWRIENSSPADKYPLVAFSPDGRSIAAILARGNLASGGNDFELRTWDVNLSGEKPVAVREKVLVRRSTDGNAPAITALRWLRDGSKIAFLAADPKAPDQYQVNVIDTHNGAVAQRTHSSQPIVTYGISDDGNTVVYATQVPIDTMRRRNERLNGLVAGPDDVGFLFDVSSRYGNDVELFVQRGDAPARSVFRTETGTTIRPMVFFERSGFVEVSPRGKSAIIGLHFVASIPEKWRQYRAPSVVDFIQEREMPPPTYALLDVASGKLSPLIDAPSVWGGATAAWSPDERSVFVSGYLPLNVGDTVAERVGKSSGAMIEVNVESRRARFVTDGVWRIADVSLRGDTVSLVRNGSATDPEVGPGVSARKLALTATAWRVADSAGFSIPIFNGTSAVAASDRIAVGIVESLDRAPDLGVFDRRTKRGDAITDLNPGLRTVLRGKVKLVEWKSGRGDAWQAHLVTPVGYSPDKKYPAVIMIMDRSFTNSYVLEGGIYRSQFPVQALANRGFIVFMTYFPKVFFDNYVQPLEREIILAGTDGAFEYLVKEAHVDSTKIGITGFSHSGYVAQYSIAKSRHHYAAAMATDNFDGSYVAYTLFDYRVNQNGIDRFYGGPPSGPAISTWEKEAPGFTLAQVRTPLLLEMHGASRLGENPGANINGWETFTGLRRLGKPVELVRYTYAIHIMQRAVERYTSAQRQIDWLAFWLKHEIDPAPPKRDQFARWTAMLK
jgi:dipeptidyl aminopeptidase/acylaminoacyl peptidase